MGGLTGRMRDFPQRHAAESPGLEYRPWRGAGNPEKVWQVLQGPSIPCEPSIACSVHRPGPGFLILAILSGAGGIIVLVMDNVGQNIEVSVRPRGEGSAPLPITGDVCDTNAGARRSWSRCWLRPIPVTLLLSLVTMAAYVIFQGMTVRANVDLIEYLTNYGGGFLAIGMTQDQPGFIVLSKLDRKEVEIHAGRDVLRTRTTASVSTSADQWSAGLRNPHVLLVTKTGMIEAIPVDWSFDDFKKLSEATDCAHGTGGRCGAPIADVQELLATWPKRRVPIPLQLFLSHYTMPH